ncbi:LCP family protein [Mumia sp. DW29H23]|uniref:LCP family protein n=1 Tax=Mumia sp. DW29H23 TaxID=3421241 RepID=UPI003D688689
MSDDVVSDAPEQAPRPRRLVRRSRPLRKALVGLASCVVLLALVLGAGAWWLQSRLGGQITQVQGAFAGLETRPARAAGTPGDAVNILLMGTDRRSDTPTTGANAEAPAWLPGEQRTDALMVLHVDGDREGASIVSIPRDAWVTVPGHGPHKVNAAFSLAGPSLAVQTVEELTDLRIDHLAVVDWQGFAAMIDALGGVTVDVPATVHDSARDRTWTAGAHELDGADALAYVGQRYGLPGGDLDRVERQQAVLRALLQRTLTRDVLANPRTVLRLLDTATRNLTVDDGWSVGDMRGLALSLRSLRADDVVFTTVPIKGLGRAGGESIVRLDRDRGREMWGALREDRLGEWLAATGGGSLPAVVD